MGKRRTHDEFISECKIKHNDMYDYPKTKFIGLLKKITVICYVHGEFYPFANNHLSGFGCPSCSSYGFSKEKEATFYVQKLSRDDLVYYKFDITNRDVTLRIKEQERSSIFDHEIIYLLEGSDDFIFHLEKTAKNSLRCGAIEREHIPDGYTETIDENQIMELEELVIDYILKNNT